MPSDSDFYHYEPSMIGAVVGAIVFGISTALHTYQAIPTGAYYMIPLVLGSACETVGYVGRILGAHEAPDYSLGPFIMQSLLLLVAPALIAASIYMVLGYVVRIVDGGKHTIIREALLTKFFVIGDLLSFLVQSAGAGMVTKQDKGSKKAGNWIIIAGLAIQLLFFGFFMVVTVNFYSRIRKAPTTLSEDPTIRWRSHLVVLFVSSILVFIRSVFRLVEYVEGEDGYLLRTEIFLYMFDALLMAGAIVVFNIYHPSEVASRITNKRAVRWVFLFHRPEPVELNDDDKYNSDSADSRA